MLERYHSLKHGRELALEGRSRRVVFRSLARTLGPWLPAERAAAVLDIGCGEGVVLDFLRWRGFSNLDGFDLSSENVKLCHERGLTFVDSHDALALADWRPEKRYDLVLCLDLIEHLPKERAVGFCSGIRSRLVPGGSAIIQTPNMGSVLGLFHRHYDLTHEWGVTENSAVDLLAAAGFSEVEIRPAWNATTLLGYAREAYLHLLHNAVFLAEGRGRPRIPTKNLLIRATP